MVSDVSLSDLYYRRMFCYLLVYIRRRRCRATSDGEGRGVFPNQLISGSTAAAGYSLISTCYQPPAVGRAIHRRPRPALPSHLTDNERTADNEY